MDPKTYLSTNNMPGAPENPHVDLWEMDNANLMISLMLSSLCKNSGNFSHVLFPLPARTTDAVLLDGDCCGMNTFFTVEAQL